MRHHLFNISPIFAALGLPVRRDHISLISALLASMAVVGSRQVLNKSRLWKCVKIQPLPLGMYSDGPFMWRLPGDRKHVLEGTCAWGRNRWAPPKFKDVIIHFLKPW